MAFYPFIKLFPEIGEDETRSLFVLKDASTGIPAGAYALLELFCDEKGCDCRRVLLAVISPMTGELHAMINYGWEPPEFYARRLGGFADPEMIEAIRGPNLNVGSPGTHLAPALLELFMETVYPDTEYLERLQRHYRMFREKIERSGIRKPPLVQKKKRKRGGRR